MGGFSVIKLVKPTKGLCSWTPHQRGVSHLLLSKTKPNAGTGSARILGESDAAVRQELRGLNSSDRIVHQPFGDLVVSTTIGGM
jgi:hypothetical protein